MITRRQLLALALAAASYDPGLAAVEQMIEALAKGELGVPRRRSR